MQPGVAVDDVVAAAADDGVAAATTEQDVAAVERHDARIEEALQAGDEIDVVEFVLGDQQLDVSLSPSMLSSKAEPLAPSVCCQTSRTVSTAPLAATNSLRFMSTSTPCVASS